MTLRTDVHLTRLSSLATLACALYLLSPIPSAACFWDRDTLAHEHKLAPGVLKVIAGDFPRRSTLVYTLRAKSRPKLLKEAGYAWLFEPIKPSEASANATEQVDSPPPQAPQANTTLSPKALAWTDDLAVALDRLKRHTEGIELLRRVLTQHPKRYETHANLGTLLIHSGAYKEGLTHLERAIEINPEAHFGREKIQIELVRYVIAQRTEGALTFPISRHCLDERSSVMRDPWLKDLPNAEWGHKLHRAKHKADTTYIEPGSRELMCLVHPPHQDCRGFCYALKAKKVSVEDGVKGILGMMRFSDHSHPILLEALGDLLLAKGYRGPNRIASMAYLQASRSPLVTEAGRRGYEALAALSIVGHRFGISKVDQTLQKALKRGARLQARIKRDEASWARKGERQLERRYKRRYLK